MRHGWGPAAVCWASTSKVTAAEHLSFMVSPARTADCLARCLDRWHLPKGIHLLAAEYALCMGFSSSSCATQFSQACYTGAERPADAETNDAAAHRVAIGEDQDAAAEPAAAADAALQAVLGGGVARVVFRNAIAARPNDIDLRRRFLEALALFQLPGGCLHSKLMSKLAAHNCIHTGAPLRCSNPTQSSKTAFLEVASMPIPMQACSPLRRRSMTASPGTLPARRWQLTLWHDAT